MTTDAAPPAMLGALRLEFDVTPRWFAPGPSYFDDMADIARVIRDHGGPIAAFLVDTCIGVTGVRIVTAVQAGPSTNAFEAARLELKTALDALDAVSPRRAKVTAQRAEMAKQKAEAEAKLSEAVAKAEDALAAPPSPIQPAPAAEPPKPAPVRKAKRRP